MAFSMGILRMNLIPARPSGVSKPRADSSGIAIATDKLASQLNCPVVATSVRTGQGLSDLRRLLAELLSPPLPVLIDRNACAVGCNGCKFAARFDWSESIANETVSGAAKPSAFSQRVDRLMTAPWIGSPSTLYRFIDCSEPDDPRLSP